MDAYALDHDAPNLPGPQLVEAAGLTSDERIGAHRALAGMPWRTETYPVAADGSVGPHPFTVESSSYRITRQQPAADPERPGDAGFTVALAETLRATYELNPADPRLEHEVVLTVGGYGDVTRRLKLAYPRRPGHPGATPEQLTTYAELTDARLAQVDIADRYQVGVPIEVKTWALSGLGTAPRPLTVAALRALAATALATPLGPYDAAPGVPAARLTGWTRNLYWNSTRTAALPLGQVGQVVLSHHEERAMLPEADIAAAYDGNVDPTDLTSAGHQLADGWWWSPGPVTTWAETARFFLPLTTTSAMGVTSSVELDQHALIELSDQDAVGNRDEAAVDYHLLAADSITDTNGVIEEVTYDPLGVAVLSSRRGQVLGTDGLAHPSGARPLAEHPGLDPNLTPAATLADPAGPIAGAGSALCYDIWAFARGDGPNVAVTVERERHTDDGEGGPSRLSRVRVAIAYHDGFGRQIQRKIKAGPGPAVRRDAAGAVVLGADGAPELIEGIERWLVSGHETLDDKAQPISVHEPFFSTTARFESNLALRRFGVATTTTYDAVGRPIRRDLPDGTSTTNAYDAWSVTESDQNDNVVGSAWATARQGLPTNDPKRRALDTTLAHAGTATVNDVDSIGRTVRTTEIGQGGVSLVTTTNHGDLGPELVTDPRGIPATVTRYDLLGAVVAERSADAGASWMLTDADGRPAITWRQTTGGTVRTRHTYDQAGRPGPPGSTARRD